MIDVGFFESVAQQGNLSVVVLDENAEFENVTEQPERAGEFNAKLAGFDTAADEHAENDQ